MPYQNDLRSIVQASIQTQQRLLEDASIMEITERMVEQLVQCFETGGKVLFCGNGGSAADAQHLAAELSGRFYLDRAPLFAEALHVNTSYLTAVANDYGYEDIYARLVQAKGHRGDVLIALSTSGNSPNIVRALQQAREQGLHTFGWTGAQGGALAVHADLLLSIPSSDTPRIQEGHMLLGHAICALVERALFE